MKIMVTGGQGMLARDIVRVLGSDNELIVCDVDDFDLCDHDAVVSAITGHAPDVVINCAAYTNVDGAESNQDRCIAVNAVGAEHIARACEQGRCRLCHISTDFVFDGEKKEPYVETDMPNPVSVYGRTKYLGELAVQQYTHDYLIVRTSWLFGHGGRNFVKTIADMAVERDEIAVVDDQWGCPSYAVDVAGAIAALLKTAARGVFHACNAGACTWHAFAQQIVALTGSRARVQAIASSQLQRAARRPVYSVMDCSKLARETGLTLRPWQDALQAYMQE